MIKLKDLLREISPAKTHITNQKPEEDPLSTSWEVTYEPNFVALIDDTEQLIKQYQNIIKKNHLQDDHMFNKNLAKLKDFRIDLEYVIKIKFPDLRKKFKNKL